MIELRCSEIKHTKMTLKQKHRITDNFRCYAFLAPWLIMLFVFTLYPFVEGIRMSFYDYGLRGQKFIGLANYIEIFTEKSFLNAIIITMKMCVLIIPGTVAFSLLVAYAIQDLSDFAKGVVKVVFYLASIVSEIALIMVWKWMFNPSYGLYKTLCRQLGMIELNLLGDATFSIPLISILVLSFTISQPIVLFSSAIDTIPQSYFEASELDGAGRLTQFFKITLPMISDVLLLVTVVCTINNLQVFVVPQLLTGGGPNGKTTTILLEIYRTAFEYGKHGLASAMGVVLFAIIGIFVAMQFILEKKSED